MTEPLYCWRCDREVDRLCVNSGTPFLAHSTEPVEDGLCDDCEQNDAEQAYERSVSDFYGGDGPMHGRLKGESDEEMYQVLRMRR